MDRGALTTAGHNKLARFYMRLFCSEGKGPSEKKPKPKAESESESKSETETKTEGATTKIIA